MDPIRELPYGPAAWRCIMRPDRWQHPTTPIPKFTSCFFGGVHRCRAVVPFATECRVVIREFVPRTSCRSALGALRAGKFYVELDSATAVDPRDRPYKIHTSQRGFAGRPLPSDATVEG